MVPRGALDPAPRIKRTLDRDLGGGTREVVEAIESSRAERAQRGAKRGKPGLRRVDVGKADGAVEGDERVRRQLERADVLDRARRGHHVAPATQHRAAQLALGRGGAPVDREDLAGPRARPRHAWSRRAITASSWHFRKPNAVMPSTSGASSAASYGSRSSTTASARARVWSSASSRAFDA